MKKIVPFFLFFVAYNIQADFVEVSVWNRQLQNGKNQQIICFGDRHDIEHVGYEQSKEIVDLMVQRNHKDDLILIEDMNDARGLAKRVHNYFEQFPYKDDQKQAAQKLERLHKIYEQARQKTVEEKENVSLFVLPHFAREQNINYSNVDFRQFLSCDAPKMDISKYHNGHLIMPWILQQLYNEVAGLNDGQVLNDVYKKALNRFEPFMNYMCDTARDNKIVFQDLADYFTNLFMCNPSAVELNLFNSAAVDDFQIWFNNLKKILYHIKHDKNSQKHREDLKMILTNIFNLASVQLVDAVILHEIYNRQIVCDVDNAVFICVGRAHMIEIEKWLPAFDYKKIDTCFDIKGVSIEPFCTPYIQAICTMDQHSETISAMIFWQRIVSAIKYLAGFFGN
jgi:hypothetical protein